MTTHDQSDTDDGRANPQRLRARRAARCSPSKGSNPPTPRCTTCSPTARSRSPSRSTGCSPDMVVVGRRCRGAGGAGDDRLRAAPAARAGALAGVDPRSAARRPRREVAGLLDLIATEDPNPALLQVNSGDAPRRRRHPLRADAAGDRIGGRRRLHRRRVGRSRARCSVRVPTRSAPWSPAGCNTSSPPTARWSTGWPAGCPCSLRRGRVRPLGLDRYGVQLRVEGEDGDHDVRLPFAKPVDDVTGLSQAIRVLMGCPFLNGLRARRL